MLKTFSSFAERFLMLTSVDFPFLHNYSDLCFYLTWLEVLRVDPCLTFWHLRGRAMVRSYRELLRSA